MLTDQMHLRQTEAFIAENPSAITIKRRSKTETASGGWKWGSPVPLPSSQTMRKVGSNRVSVTIQRTTTDGKQVIPSAVLVGLPDADIQVGDLFDLDGKTYEVLTVDNDHPPWRMQAEVVAMFVYQEEEVPTGPLLFPSPSLFPSPILYPIGA